MTTSRWAGSMGRFGKFVAAVSMLAAFSFGGSKAFAAGPGFLGDLAPPSSISIGNTIFGDGASFNDVYSFTVSADSSLSSILASVSFYDIIGISGFSSSLWTGSTLLATGITNTAGPFITSGINFSPLLAGPPSVLYEIRATGTVFGPAGSYGGAMVTAPVPEPEIYAMLGVGLGLLGWVKRKKKAEAEAVAA
jgi:PEP-CTERM motif